MAALAHNDTGSPRAHGRCQHVPQPRADRQACHDPRPRVGGRAVLGIGGAWFEREHDAFGSTSARARASAWTGSTSRSCSCAGCSMASGSPTRSDVPFHDALSAPRPVQPHLPIFIGGAGRARRCARSPGTPTAGTCPGRSRRSVMRWRALDAHAADVGATSRPREDRQLPDRHRRRRRVAQERMNALMTANGIDTMGGGPICGFARPGRRRHPAVPRPRLRDGHRPDAGAIRRARPSSGSARSRSTWRSKCRGAMKP